MLMPNSTFNTPQDICTHTPPYYTTLMNPTQKSPQRAFALQRYLLLHSQHEALRKHLDHITTSLPPITSSLSCPPDQSRQASFSSPPESEDNYPSPAPAPALHHRKHRSSSITNTPHIRPTVITRRYSLPNVIDESILGDIEKDENKLKNVNAQIKCTLTNLLNCEGVRGDGRYRMWVQTRLMDAEKELTRSRSRTCAAKFLGEPPPLTDTMLFHSAGPTRSSGKNINAILNRLFRSSASTTVILVPGSSKKSHTAEGSDSSFTDASGILERLSSPITSISGITANKGWLEKDTMRYFDQLLNLEEVFLTDQGRLYQIQKQDRAHDGNYDSHTRLQRLIQQVEEFLKDRGRNVAVSGHWFNRN